MLKDDVVSSKKYIKEYLTFLYVAIYSQVRKY